MRTRTGPKLGRSARTRQRLRGGALLERWRAQFWTTSSTIHVRAHARVGTVKLTIAATDVRRAASSAVRPLTPATAFQVTNARVRRSLKGAVIQGSGPAHPGATWKREPEADA